jgi:hypothetical protein
MTSVVADTHALIWYIFDIEIKLYLQLTKSICRIN